MTRLTDMDKTERWKKAKQSWLNLGRNMESGGSQENITDLDTLKEAVDSLWSSGAGDAEDDERREILLKYIRDTHPEYRGKQHSR